VTINGYKAPGLTHLRFVKNKPKQSKIMNKPNRWGLMLPLPPQLLRIMRLTIIIMTMFLIQVSAASRAQVTLIEKNARLKTVIESLKKQTGMDVFYNDFNIGRANPVTLNLRNVSLDEALEACFKGQPLTYTIENRTIIIKSREKNFLDRMTDFFAATEIKGRVVDEGGKPVGSASVKVKGYNKVVVTGSDGRFSITVPEDGVVLIISYVGFMTREVAAQQNMTIVMQLDPNKLNEMVVVGYGSTRRKDLTGSVASINVTEVRDVPFATVDQALSGKAAGVQVVQADGSPGGVAKIRIRGGTSLMGGNDPLYIIDGIQVQIQNRYLQSAAEILSPVEGYGPNASQTISGSFARGLNSLGGLNINDIETIDILKDASATAIYGSRAANGVVIITTKKG
jgi:TonB-dependent SusC/RagA subfamily outer membrane receptor